MPPHQAQVPAQSTEQQHNNNVAEPTRQIMAEAQRIVTSFMIYLGTPENINRNAVLLVPEFLALSGNPHDYMPQLTIIAIETERAKGNNNIAPPPQP